MTFSIKGIVTDFGPFPTSATAKNPVTRQEDGLSCLDSAVDLAGGNDEPTEKGLEVGLR